MGESLIDSHGKFSDKPRSLIMGHRLVHMTQTERSDRLVPSYPRNMAIWGPILTNYIYTIIKVIPCALQCTSFSFLFHLKKLFLYFLSWKQINISWQNPAFFCRVFLSIFLKYLPHTALLLAQLFSGYASCLNYWWMLIAIMTVYCLCLLLRKISIEWAGEQMLEIIMHIARNFRSCIAHT